MYIYTAMASRSMMKQNRTSRLSKKKSVSHSCTPIPTPSCTDRHSSQFKNNHFTEMCSGSEEGWYLRLKDFRITQL